MTERAQRKNGTSQNIEICTDKQGHDQGCNIFSTEICPDNQGHEQGCNIIATDICTDKQG